MSNIHAKKHYGEPNYECDICKEYINLLPKEHLIHRFYSEHEIILKYLSDLNEVRKNIDKLDTPLDHPELFVQLIKLAEQLLEVEKHHLREETILFPELQKRNINQYHFVLKSEHSFLKDYKENFLEFVKNLEATDFISYKTQMNYMSNGIIGLLREHIYKENKFVFPMALEVIKDENDWKLLKEKSDTVGYSFYIPDVK
ncbi:MAG: hemerythrin domain-containing protein [Candidatus Marinimicrobia bacterium]|nr:hemerythrin domain-containing protein [Candidatus Neomarinimicrobiota bacterium]MBL7023153.1 hemerythrin domain-containing protein [Candidatus Neomarinimicrobiota bacterium]MBL7109039.1 hemerythrin domain-containing protein [Candidatus Neomarinimicrobiota bacterium]